MSLSIAVIDYGAGNLRSIRRALEAAGAEVTVSSDSGDVRQADAVVFPGVGAAGAAMDRLHHLGLVDVIGDVVAEGRPFLGICLGMQLLFEHQEEGNTARAWSPQRTRPQSQPSGQGATDRVEPRALDPGGRRLSSRRGR